MRTHLRVLATSAALLGVLAAVPALAQPTGTGVGIGALGGFTMTSVNVSSNPFDFSTGNANGYMVGLWFGGNRNGRVGVMGEASWLVKRFDVENSEQELRYVELPVLLRVNTGSLQREKPSLYFLGGPVFDIQVGAKEDGEDIKDVYEGLDIGMLAGVGFEVARIGIEARYTWGLKSVLATDSALAAGFGDTKLNTLQIVGKIRFN